MSTHMSWAEWDAYQKTVGVRNFATHPINKVPNRTNRVCAGGNLYVSSDCLAELNRLRPVAPRNASVRFYNLEGSIHGMSNDERMKAQIKQTKAAIALAKLGLCEGDKPAPLPSRAMDEPVHKAPPAPKRTRLRRNATGEKGGKDALRYAVCAWLSGRACLDCAGRNYMVKDAQGRLRVASWNRMIKTMFPTVDAFHAEAHTWRVAKRQDGRPYAVRNV